MFTSEMIILLWVNCEAWWHMHLVPAVGRQKQVDLSEFQATQDYIMKS